ncbi:MAG TPA: calcium/sodium antiporter [Kiritimatiellia bacterium]|nr:calcium/sodium antiporter [Kiritimatiellia bacterium]HMP33142.1 calcium/sodium antiporter [Kiritimatiellia bacterium]
MLYAACIAGGFVLLSIGADALIRGSVRLSLRSGISPLVIGLTVVAFGTSTPELFVSLKANLGGSGDIAVGNIVGSNIFNIAVILGLAALIQPIRVQSQLIRQDVPVMIAASLLFYVMVFDREVSRIEGIVLFTLLIGYIVLTIRQARQGGEDELAEEITHHMPAATTRPIGDSAWIIGGILLLVGGSQLLVQGAVGLAREAKVSEAIIALTIVAAGTGLPELATSIAAALKKESDLAVGNVIGSNIFNLLCIGGFSASIKPLRAPDIEAVDLSTMAVLAVLLLPVLRIGMRVGRIEGVLLLASYGAYLYYIWPVPH